MLAQTTGQSFETYVEEILLTRVGAEGVQQIPACAEHPFVPSEKDAAQPPAQPREQHNSQRPRLTGGPADPPAEAVDFA